MGEWELDADQICSVCGVTFDVHELLSPNCCADESYGDLDDDSAEEEKL